MPMVIAPFTQSMCPNPTCLPLEELHFTSIQTKEVQPSRNLPLALPPRFECLFTVVSTPKPGRTCFTSSLEPTATQLLSQRVHLVRMLLVKPQVRKTQQVQ